MNEERIQPKATQEEYWQFLQEVLQATSASQGVPVFVCFVLQQNLELLDSHFAQILQVWASHSLLRAEDEKAFELARTIGNFSNLISDFSLGRRADNLEIAIVGYEVIATIFKREKDLKMWAINQNNLGIAYVDRIEGEKKENLEKAIAHFQAALQVRTREVSLQDWAETQNNLGTAYCKRIEGEKKENLEKAIAHFQAALQVRTREVSLQDWAETQNNLGNAYLDRIEGEKRENLEKAIFHFQATLQVFTREASPQKWAMTQNNLGIVYRNRIEGEKRENLEKAIVHFQAALQVFTREASPQKWAMTQNNLGNAYLDRIEEEKGANLEKAIIHYEAALQICTRKTFPQDWAETQNHLGVAYSNRIKGEKRKNLEKAIIHYEAALQIYTREAFPLYWARVQNNLGNAYYEYIARKRGKNLEKAIIHYKAALQVYNRETLPQEWATTQNNLGVVYLYQIEKKKRENIEGEKKENLEKAIFHFQAALQVFTREALPQKWAMTQNNLGNAYPNRIEGEKRENLEKAIAHYQAALEVRTRIAFPQEHTGTLSNLGSVYLAQSYYHTNDSENKRVALLNAYNIFEQALETVEYLRGEIVSGDEAKRKLNEEWNRLYLRMVEVCLMLDNDRAAIEYVDRSKARNLVELIATRDAYPQGEIPPETRQRLQYLRQAIDQENRRLEQEEEKSRDYTQIAQLREEFQEKYPYKPLTFDNIQSLLDEETAIFEWYILNDKCLTFTLTAQTLDLWTSSPEDLNKLTDWTDAYLNAYNASKNPNLSEIEAQKLRQEWQDSLPQRFKNLSEILYIDRLLDTLFTKLPTCQKLILIPHRYLHLFPIHALPIPVQTVGADCIRPIHRDRVNLEGASIAPLQEIFPKGVSYAPNCQLLQQAQSRLRPDFNRLLAIANPTEDLIFADLEVETIYESFPENQDAILQGQNATKPAFLAKDFTQTHHLYFSCHGAFSPNSPLDSGLQLADDVLTLTEIIGSLNLSQCRLVTLSACETGQVALDTTDEYISIASGFILAGSPSVIVTLWSVNQISTALLLIKTYETLQKYPGKLAISLKTAQMWLRDATVRDFHQWTQDSPLLTDNWRKNLQEFFQQEGEKKALGWESHPYESPYHWAAFCIVGQGEQ